jgi:hypothetical protein
MAEKQTYPMISEKNWWDLRNQFKKTIPANVNTSYVKSLLGFNSDDSARNNIITPLKQIGLIDEDGKPTALAIDWRSDDKYSAACKTILDSRYPRELTDLFPNDEVDISKLKSWFMDTASIGQSAASKVANTFMLIRSARIRQLSEKASASPKKVAKTAKEKPAKETVQTTPVTKDTLPVNNESTHVAPPLHIDIQVHISPDASADQIDKIFESMAKHLYGRK